MKTPSLNLKVRMVARLIGLSPYCSHTEMGHLVGELVTVWRTRMCGDCKIDHYYIEDPGKKKELGGDLNIEHFVKANTRPYKITTTDGEVITRE